MIDRLADKGKDWMARFAKAAQRTATEIELKVDESQDQIERQRQSGRFVPVLDTDKTVKMQLPQTPAPALASRGK